MFEGKCREAAVGLDGALVADAAFVEDVQKAFASTKPKKFSLPKNEKELEKRLLAVPKGTYDLAFQTISAHSLYRKYNRHRRC